MISIRDKRPIHSITHDEIIRSALLEKWPELSDDPR